MSQVTFGSLLSYMEDIDIGSTAVLKHVWESVPDSDGNRFIVLVFLDELENGSVKEVRISVSENDIQSCVFDPLK